MLGQLYQNVFYISRTLHRLLVDRLFIDFLTFNPIQDGSFGAGDGGGGGKRPRTTLNPLYLLHSNETWDSFTLTKEDPKIYKSRRHLLSFKDISIFLRNSQYSLYRKIKIKY